eukprot:173462_1
MEPETTDTQLTEQIKYNKPDDQGYDEINNNQQDVNPETETTQKTSEPQQLMKSTEKKEKEEEVELIKEEKEYVQDTKTDDDDENEEEVPFFIVFNYRGDSLNVPKEKPNKYQLSAIKKNIQKLREERKKSKLMMSVDQEIDDDDISTTLNILTQETKGFSDEDITKNEEKMEDEYASGLAEALQDQQAMLGEEPWIFVKGDQTDKLREYVDNHKDEGVYHVTKRGAFQETILHVAILYG